MAKKKATSESSIDHVKKLAKDAIKKGKRKVLTAALELAIELLHKVGTKEKQVVKKAKKATKKASGKAKKVVKKVIGEAKKTAKKVVKKTKKATSKKKVAKK